jgi:hypothetical protein
MFTAASFVGKTNCTYALNNSDVVEDEEGKLVRHQLVQN